MTPPTPRTTVIRCSASLMRLSAASTISRMRWRLLPTGAVRTCRRVLCAKPAVPVGRRRGLGQAEHLESQERSPLGERHAVVREVVEQGEDPAVVPSVDLALAGDDDALEQELHLQREVADQVDGEVKLLLCADDDQLVGRQRDALPRSKLVRLDGRAGVVADVVLSTKAQVVARGTDVLARRRADRPAMPQRLLGRRAGEVTQRDDVLVRQDARAGHASSAARGKRRSLRSSLPRTASAKSTPSTLASCAA